MHRIDDPSLQTRPPAPVDAGTYAMGMAIILSLAMIIAVVVIVWAVLAGLR